MAAWGHAAFQRLVAGCKRSLVPHSVSALEVGDQSPNTRPDQDLDTT